MNFKNVCADLVGAVSDAAPSPAPVTVRGSARLSRVVARCRRERLVSRPQLPCGPESRQVVPRTHGPGEPVPVPPCRADGCPAGRAQLSGFF